MEFLTKIHLALGLFLITMLTLSLLFNSYKTFLKLLFIFLLEFYNFNFIVTHPNLKIQIKIA